MVRTFVVLMERQAGQPLTLASRGRMRRYLAISRVMLLKN